MKLNKNTRLILKLIVILASYIYIFYRIYNNKNIFESGVKTFSFSSLSIILFIIILAMMYINWLIESAKWRFLVRKFQIVSINRSMMGIFTGLTAAIFTPNRIGEYFGRVVVLEEYNRGKGVFSTIVGSFSQVVTTIIFGATSLILLFDSSNGSNLQKYNDIYTWLGILLVSAFFIIVYFQIKWFAVFFGIFPFLRRYKKQYDVIREYSKKDLLITLIYSISRYLIFLTQYLILLYIFKVEVSLENSILCICAGYFVILFIPSFTLAEIGIRGTVALFFLEMFSTNTLGILSAAVLIWIINLAIPALIGSIILYKIKL